MLVNILTADYSAMRMSAARRMIFLGMVTFLCSILFFTTDPPTAGLASLCGLLLIVGGSAIQIQDFRLDYESVDS